MGFFVSFFVFVASKIIFFIWFTLYEVGSSIMGLFSSSSSNMNPNAPYILKPMNSNVNRSLTKTNLRAVSHT